MKLKQKGPKMMKDVSCSHTKNNVTTLQIILTQRVEFHFEGIQVKRIRSPGHVKDNHKNMSLTFISFHDQKKKQYIVTTSCNEMYISDCSFCQLYVSGYIIQVPFFT